MVKVLAVVALLAVAQLIPSCDEGGGRTVIGYVQEKRLVGREAIPYLIVINQIEYPAPYEFWSRVGPGDLVKYDGRNWTLVRKART